MYWPHPNTQSTLKHLIKDAIIFFTMGALSALINILSFAFFWETNFVSYTTAISLAYILSVIFHFIANRHITFKAHGPNLLQQLPRYTFLVVLNYIITLFIAQYTTEALLLSPYLGVIAAIAITGLLGFFLSKFWIFKCAV